MSDTLSAARSAAGSAGVTGATAPEIIVPAPTPTSPPVSPFAGHERPVGTEPLARIEDKTSRIEEKLARSEASMQRVVDRFELASARMGEVALQSDLSAVRTEVSYITRKVRRMPGAGTLLVTAFVTAVLTAIAVVLVLRYVPGALQR
ncbi:MAG: hypothetical protein JWR08_2348 [Enterovirga sp.]|jgi:hypothetical protein|nr:hypothetical protein [Enterovirga sp.]